MNNFEKISVESFIQLPLVFEKKLFFKIFLCFVIFDEIIYTRLLSHEK
jgi:hypothetical protein